MNTLKLTNTCLPVFSGGDFLAAANPFFHADRVAPFHILIYVTEGCIYVTEDEEDYEVRPGELLLLKSGVHHYGKHPVPRGTRWHFIHFYMEQPQGIPVFEPDYEPIMQYREVCYAVPLPKLLTGLSGTALEQRISSFTDYVHGEDPMKKWKINERLYQLLSDIAFYGQRTEAPQTISDGICRYLTEHYQEPFCAKLMEQQFYLSYKRLAAVFKRDKGQSMQQFQINIRMMQACHLLRSTLLPVGEIAARVGYTDALYFSRLFHVHQGMSPSDYRRQPPVW